MNLTLIKARAAIAGAILILAATCFAKACRIATEAAPAVDAGKE